MPLLLKIMLLELVSGFSIQAAAKRQWFVHLEFDSNLQLINDISSDLQKLIKFFNGAAIFTYSELEQISLPPLNNLVLHLEDIKTLIF